MTRRVYKGQHIGSSGTEVLRDGDLAVDLTTNTLYIHDGTTPGGNLLKDRLGPVTTISSALSSDSGNPTELPSGYQVILLTHFDGTIRYGALPNGTIAGETVVLKYSSTGNGGSSRNISGTGLGATVNINTESLKGATFMWSGSAWIVVSTTEI